MSCTPSRAPLRLGIAAQQSPSQMLVYLASGLGHFGDEGLRVQLEEFPGSSKALEALLGGSLDVVSGYHDQILKLPAGSPRLMSFMAMTNGHLVALVASGKSECKKLPDLRGKTVGVTTLGSATHLWLDFVLRQAGMKGADVSPVAIGTAGRAVAAMEHGQVCAGVVSDYTARTLEKRGGVRILSDVRSPAGARAVYGVDGYPGAVLFASHAWVEANPDTVRRIIRAIARTREWVKSHSVDEVVARLPASHHGDDLAVYTEVIRGTVAMLTTDGKITREGAEAASHLAGAEGDAGRSYTNEFLEQR